MSKPDPDPSVEKEPQSGDRPARPDPSERAADQTFKKARSREAATQENLARHSVFDEPDVLPGRPPEVLDEDWYCSACGYNLRGLPTGHRCPECGHIELYRPPPRDEVSLRSWYRDRKAEPDSRARWLLHCSLALLTGASGGAVAAVLNNVPLLTSVVVLGPVLAEVMKLLVVVLVVELRPDTIRGAWRIWLLAVLSASACAVVQNLLYFQWYIAAPSLVLVLWRWGLCTALHLFCTAVAASAFVKAWRRIDREGGAPPMTSALKPLGWAMVVHAGYNLCAASWGAIAYTF